MRDEKIEVGAAVFVKTPGISPLKTRLAATLGKIPAETFYRLACRATANILSTVPGLQAYWALAEDSATARSHELWAGLPHLLQGRGELGQRLTKVYDELLQRHKTAVLLGADTPQLSTDLLDLALRLSSEGQIVLGPAVDGGFYLFASQIPLPGEIWTAVSYSSETTLVELCNHLGHYTRAKQVFLPPLRDVDNEADLIALVSTLMKQNGLGPAQFDILAWYKDLYA